MTFLLIVVAVIVVGLVGSILWVRSLDHDASQWHVDPTTAPKPSSPNSYRVGDAPEADEPARNFDVDSADLSAAFDRMVASQPRVTVLADDRTTSGSTTEGIVTYVQRSALFGFPDYITVQFDQQGDGGSRLTIFSRSRLGESDLGVNKKRVESWLASLSANLA